LAWSLGWISAPRVAREGRDDPVGVHVSACAGSCLEDVDRKLVVVITGSHSHRRMFDGCGLPVMEDSDLAIDSRGT
jgi:hypothetical protein